MPASMKPRTKRRLKAATPAHPRTGREAAS